MKLFHRHAGPPFIFLFYGTYEEKGRSVTDEEVFGVIAEYDFCAEINLWADGDFDVGQVWCYGYGLQHLPGHARWCYPPGYVAAAVKSYIYEKVPRDAIIEAAEGEA